MKKLYLALLAIFFIQTTKAQVPTCSLDPIFIAGPKDGVWPDSLTNFASGTVGQPYVQNITVKVPLDTIQTSLKFCFNRVVLSTPTNVTNYNLPPGLNFGSSTSALSNGTISGAISLKFPGNANNCASIYGIPTTAGSYTLQLKIQPYNTLQPVGNCTPNPNVNGGTNVASPSILGYYVINISPVSVNEIVNAKNFELRNVPNPFSGKTTIKFNVGDESLFTIKVRDVLGKTIHDNSFKTKPGENAYELDASKFAAGMYFYTITYKNYSETKRMIIASHS